MSTNIPQNKRASDIRRQFKMADMMDSLSYFDDMATYSSDTEKLPTKKRNLSKKKRSKKKKKKQSKGDKAAKVQAESVMSKHEGQRDDDDTCSTMSCSSHISMQSNSKRGTKSQQKKNRKKTRQSKSPPKDILGDVLRHESHLSPSKNQSILRLQVLPPSPPPPAMSPQSPRRFLWKQCTEELGNSIRSFVEHADVMQKRRAVPSPLRRTKVSGSIKALVEFFNKNLFYSRLAPSPSTTTTTTTTSRSTTSSSSTQNEAALTEDEEAVVTKFHKMLKIGVPRDAVRQK